MGRRSKSYLTPSDPSRNAGQALSRERGKLINSFSSLSPLEEGFSERLISMVRMDSRDVNEEIFDYQVPKKTN
jgi:hypothetical protein